jgi:hypothetical protein
MDEQFVDEDIVEEDDVLEFEEDETEESAEGEEYEEIDSDEVDRVVSALETLNQSIQSENIRHFIEEASNSIYFLIYSEDEEEDAEDELLEEAA